MKLTWEPKNEIIARGLNGLDRAKFFKEGISGRSAIILKNGIVTRVWAKDIPPITKIFNDSKWLYVFLFCAKAIGWIIWLPQLLFSFVLPIFLNPIYLLARVLAWFGDILATRMISILLKINNYQVVAVMEQVEFSFRISDLKLNEEKFVGKGYFRLTSDISKENIHGMKGLFSQSNGGVNLTSIMDQFKIDLISRVFVPFLKEKPHAEIVNNAFFREDFGSEPQKQLGDQLSYWGLRIEITTLRFEHEQESIEFTNDEKEASSLINGRDGSLKWLTVAHWMNLWKERKSLL